MNRRVMGECFIERGIGQGAGPHCRLDTRRPVSMAWDSIWAADDLMSFRMVRGVR